MRFWHIVTDSKGEVKEQHLCGNNKRKLSLEFLQEILKGDYKIIPTTI